MGREIDKLSAGAVTALLKAGKPGSFGDGAGLYLVVTGAGAGSWAFRYSTGPRGHQKSHWMGLGAANTFGLKEARERARRCRQQVQDGIDPLAQRREAKATSGSGLTFQAVAELYITAHEPAWRSKVHAQQWRQSLKDHVFPELGALPVAAIGTGDVMKALEPLWPKKPETASRARQRIESILDYAKARGWRSGDNPARWRGHLSNLLAAPGKVRPIEHHPAMPWHDVPAFLSGLGGRQGTAAKALAFLILTAARSGEARGAVWSELDLVKGVWTVPASRMKAAREHRVPLSESALDLLRSVRPEELEPRALVFPGAKADKALSDVAVAKLVPGGATIHGFRSSFRTWAGETTNFPREVVEQALAHRIGDAVEQAYARGDLFARRRHLMDAWAKFCSGQAPVGDVSDLESERARRVAQ